MSDQPPSSAGSPEGEPPQYGPPGTGPQPPQQYPGQQYGQPYSGQPQPGQPYPGQQYPGQQYPGQPYPGQQYPGQQAAYGYPQQQPPAPSNGAGIAALILGVLGILSVWTVVGGIVLGALAVILGFVGRSQFKKQRATNGGMSLAGIILGFLSIVVAIILVVVGIGLFKMVGGQDFVDCVRDAGNDRAAVQRCEDQFQQSIQDRLSVTLTPAPR